jgi:hypothetical protein
VCNGVASGWRRKKCVDSSANTTGATAAWTMSELDIDSRWRAMAIVPSHAAHPMSA